MSLQTSMSFYEAQKEVLKNIHITLFHTMTMCIDFQKKTKTPLIVVQVTLFSVYLLECDLRTAELYNL